MSAVNILVMGLLSACAAMGLIRISAIRIARYVLVTVIATLALLLGIRLAFDTLGVRYEGYELFIQRDLLDEAHAELHEVVARLRHVGGAQQDVPDPHGRGRVVGHGKHGFILLGPDSTGLTHSGDTPRLFSFGFDTRDDFRRLQPSTPD